MARKKGMPGSLELSSHARKKAGNAQDQHADGIFECISQCEPECWIFGSNQLLRAAKKPAPPAVAAWKAPGSILKPKRGDVILQADEIRRLEQVVIW